MAAYWSGTPEQFALITEVQELKRAYVEGTQYHNFNPNMDRFVMANPVTGQDVPKADLIYAKTHLQQIYESGAIKDDRWAFLWYH